MLMEKKGRKLEEAEQDPTPLKKRRISKEEEEKEEILEKVRFCKYYAKGNCSRGEKCSFLHKREVCKYWLQANCINDECPFLHEFKKSRIPQCYFDRTRGICNNPGCMFLHLNDPRKNQDRNEDAEETAVSLSLGSQPEESPETESCPIALACLSISQLQTPSGLWKVNEKLVSLFPHSISSWFPPQISKWIRKDIPSKDPNGYYLEVIPQESYWQIWVSALTLAFFEREKSKWEGRAEGREIQRANDLAFLTLQQTLSENSVPELMRLARKLLK